MKKHINIPIFIPHYGCPNACVFCNQKKITGKPSFVKENVMNDIETVLSTVDLSVSEVELAFFGGSFTALPKNEILDLLTISDHWLSLGKISSVRLSTRPDAIDEEILDILHSHGVKTIELGIQSFSDNVLSASKRGHTALQSEKACKMIKERGFELIGQMMVGLPSSTTEDEIMTAKRICELSANGARVYPTVVFPDTELDRMKNDGRYTPLSNEDAVIRTAEVLSVFARYRVPVIRIGLCANETLSDEQFSTNYHPSVGEKAINLIFRKNMYKLLSEARLPEGKNAVFSVAKGKISQAVGQKRSNVTALLRDFKLNGISVVEKDYLDGYAISLEII